jgi:dihydropteroate synthase
VDHSLSLDHGPAPLPVSLTSVERCLVMGILNVTPDSFSDGGQWARPAQAIPRGLALAAQGADIVDVGGESTRPGAVRIGAQEELDRVVPVVAGLVAAGVAVSIDTSRAAVAQAAVELGAVIVNDVSAGVADPGMAALVARTGVVYVAMHSRGASDTPDEYDDVVADVAGELGERVAALLAAGVLRHQVVLDPGLGFAKSGANNWPLLARLGELRALGHPLLIGASRKRFLGVVLATETGVALPPAERDDATTAVTALVAAAGAWCVRVHHVAGSADAVRVAAAWTSAAREDIT